MAQALQSPWPPVRRRGRDGLWGWALALALLWHALAAALLLATSSTRPAPRPRPQPFALRAMDPEQWERNRGARATTKPMPIPPGQTVDVVHGNDQVPTQARYLAESNNRVAKETRARQRPSHDPRPAGKTISNAPAPAEARPSSPPVGGASAMSQVDRMLEEGGLLPRLSPVLGSPATPAEPADRPSDVPSEAEGGGAPSDELTGVAEGDGTQLNTRAWAYAGFLNRIKQAILKTWDPDGRLRAKDPRGNRFGGTDRTTVLHVLLRPDGRLQDVYVAESSGLDFLDAEAVQAFERAAPFPNPPRQLVQNGIIAFAFAFHVTHDWRLAPSARGRGSGG